MQIFEYNGRTFEVETRYMDPNTINIVFLDEDDFMSIFNWARNADLSRIVVVNEKGAETVYEGFTQFKALTALQATDQDFWEGIRMVVALGKPITE